MIIDDYSLLIVGDVDILVVFVSEILKDNVLFLHFIKARSSLIALVNPLQSSAELSPLKFLFGAFIYLAPAQFVGL